MTLLVPIADSYWLVPDKLLAGEYPGTADEAAARAKLERFLDAGIRSFIDLTEESDGLAPYDPLLQDFARTRHVEVRYHRFGIQDLGVPTREKMCQILEAIRDETAAGRPVYFHCWGGIGRTGTVAGCWLVEEGIAGDDAITRIRELRQGTPGGGRRSPETEEQRAFIRNWRKVPGCDGAE